MPARSGRQPPTMAASNPVVKATAHRPVSVVLIPKLIMLPSFPRIQCRSLAGNQVHVLPRAINPDALAPASRRASVLGYICEIKPRTDVTPDLAWPGRVSR